MPNIFSYLVAGAYAGATALFSAASATTPANSWIWDLVSFAIAIVTIVSLWKIFQKAGQKGWAAIIPVYSNYIQLKIVKKPAWWLILYFVPLVNIVISINVLYNMALVFNKGGGFAAGLVFLPFIFYPILAFGKAQYRPSSQPEIPNPMTPGPEPPPVPPQPGL